MRQFPRPHSQESRMEKKLEKHESEQHMRCKLFVTCYLNDVLAKRVGQCSGRSKQACDHVPEAFGLCAG